MLRGAEGPWPWAGGVVHFPDRLRHTLVARVAFVTGGGSGIGASIVEHLCAQHARVAFVDINRSASETLVKTVADRGLPAPIFIPCDLREIPALQSAIAEVRSRLGPI